jgi:hypothetical protein
MSFFTKTFLSLLITGSLAIHEGNDDIFVMEDLQEDTYSSSSSTRSSVLVSLDESWSEEPNPSTASDKALDVVYCTGSVVRRIPLSKLSPSAIEDIKYLYPSLSNLHVPVEADETQNVQTPYEVIQTAGDFFKKAGFSEEDIDGMRLSIKPHAIINNTSFSQIIMSGEHVFFQFFHMIFQLGKENKDSLQHFLQNESYTHAIKLNRHGEKRYIYYPIHGTHDYNAFVYNNALTEESSHSVKALIKKYLHS